MAQCVNCGRVLGKGAQWCPDCGTPRGRTVRCHSCGNEFPTALGECHRCGASGAQAYGPKYYLGVVAAVLIMVLIFLGLSAFGWYQHARNVEDQQRWFEEQKHKNEREMDEFRKQNGFPR